MTNSDMLTLAHPKCHVSKSQSLPSFSSYKIYAGRKPKVKPFTKHLVSDLPWGSHTVVLFMVLEQQHPP